MSQNPYRPSTDTPSSSEIPLSISAARLGSVIGSIVFVLLGIAVAGLGLLPSDAPGFFLLTGAHLIACGTLGVTCAWVQGRGGVRYLLCWTSLIVNAALVVRVAILILDGTMRGPLLVAAPLLLGLPAALNVASALNLRRGARQIT
jgi:hypothetical protein